MAACHRCGSAVASNDHFCGECGTPVLAAPPPLTEPVPTVPPPTDAAHVSAAPLKAQRMAIYVGGAVIGLVLVVVVLLWTGGGEDGTPVGSEPAASTTPGTVVSETTATTTTTLPPPTTVAPSTEPPTTPAPAGPTVAAGWRPAQMIPEAQIPPFDASWAGAPSPQIVDWDAQIPDGVYWVNYVAQDGVSLTLALGRFESCSILNDEFVCGPGPYGSNAIGRVQPAEGNVTVPLDDTTRVVIEGWDCGPVVLEGNGADLGAMYAALGADYTRAFTNGINAGGDPYDLMVAARYDPTTGFAAPSAECDDGFSLVWRSGGGPPVLVQQVIDYETGGAMDPAMLIIPTAVERVGDQTTVYFYAGFFS